MNTAAIDWNWFFSSLAQSVAALVGIFAAFIITKIVNNQAEFKRKNTHLRELLSVSAKHRDALAYRSFDWYNERTLEYALERLEWIDSDEEFKSPEEYYAELNLPQYMPRSFVLTEIEKKIGDETAKRNAPPRSYSDYRFSALDPEFTRFRTIQDGKIRDAVSEEGERIRAVILEIRQHLRLVKLHLVELEGNPESSTLIGFSIVGAILLFVLGVIYPLSFLPVDTHGLITYSIRAFFPMLLSFKGFLLTSVSIVFLAMMVTFWRANHSLKYDLKEIDDLRRAEAVENYSEYLRIMKQNQREQRTWSEGKSTSGSVVKPQEEVL